MQSSPLSEIAGPDSGPILGEPITKLPFSPHEVDALTDAELDELTHGVIALDPRGRILRYNLAEASLARLDRHSVIGRLFFDEVAPCTKTPAFFGAFQRMVEQGTAGVPRFGYLLDFKFGAQECDVEMVKARSAPRYYVFVTRRRFSEARPGLPEGWAAPLQSELDPADQALGVLRHRSGNRVAVIDSDFLGTLLTTAQRSHPLDWPRVGYEWGNRWGRRWVVGLEMECAEAHAASLHELPFAQSMRLVADRLAASGWGQVRFNTDFTSSGVLVADIERSLLSELSEAGQAGERPQVQGVMEGLLAAVFSHLAGRRLAAVSVPTEERAGSRYLIIGENFRDVAVAAVSALGRASLAEIVSVMRTAAAAVRS